MNDERSLVEGVLRGEPAPFVTLVRRYQGLVFHVVSSVVENPADREELCQETLLRIHRKLHTFRHGSLRSWIARVARSVALNHVRRRAVRQDRLTEPLEAADRRRPDYALAAMPPAERVMARRLRAEVAKLPEPVRSVVRLFYFEELSIGEIETALRIPAGTVKSHLFRARRELRARLEGDANGTME